MTNINQPKEQSPAVPEIFDKDEGASFGKFRTGQDLLNAYNALEAEFTRRSQRIKELEAELSDKTESDKWSEKVKELNSKYPVARKLESELTDYLKSNEDLLNDDNCLEKALLHVLAERYANSNERLPNEPTHADTAETDLASRNTGNISIESENVPTAISAVPKLAQGGGEIPIVPSFRPSSVREAGLLAVEQFKKAKENN